MTRRDFFLLLLILALGGGITLFHSAREGKLSRHVRIDGLEFLEGTPHSFTEIEQADIRPGGRLEIESPRGSIEIGTWDEPRVRVEARKQIRAESEAAARSRADELHLEMSPFPEGLRVRMGSASGKEPSEGTSFDYTVLVPRNIRIRAQTRHGDLSVHGVQGEVIVRDAHGDIEVAELGGSCDVTNENGAVTATRVAGKLTIANSHDDVQVEEAGSDVAVTTRHSSVSVQGARASVDIKDIHGDVRVEGAQRSVRVEAPHCTISIERVGGEVNATGEAERIEVSDVKGAVTIQAAATSVRLTEVSGPIRVTGTHTDVEIIRPLSDVEVQTTHQEIDLTPPPGRGFRVEAASDLGEVESEIPELHLPTDRPAKFAGSLGDGRSRYRLSTSHSTIRLRTPQPAPADTR